MIRFLKCLSLLWLILPLTGCTDEKGPVGPNTEQANILIKIRALEPEVKVRVIFTDPITSEVLVNESMVGISDAYRAKVRTGRLNLFILANEPDRLTPTLDHLKFETHLQPLTVLYDEIPTTEDPPGSVTSSNLPLMKMIPVKVRVQNNDPETGEISPADSENWSKTLAVELDRLPVRLSLNMRKNTQDPDATIVVQKVRLINVPSYSYWVAQKYTDPNFFQPPYPYNDPSGISFTQNIDDEDPEADNYTVVFSNFLIPEYLPVDDSDPEQALTMDVHVLFNGAERVYHIPLPTAPGALTYSLERNRAHTLNVTMKGSGGILTDPEIVYEVGDWEDGGGEIEDGKTITFSRSWVGNPVISGNDILVGGDQVLEFKFRLLHPLGATWQATLTNPVDFAFDYSDGAVSSGIGGTTTERTIRIKPRKTTHLHGLNTEFYITVNYGEGNVELDLPMEIVGTGNRYRITQIPD